MNNLKILGLSALVALAVALGVSALTPPSNGVIGPQGPQGEQGLVGPVGLQGPVGPQGPAGQSVQGLQSLLTSLQNVLSQLQIQPTKLRSVVGTDLSNPNCTGGLCIKVESGVCRDATTTLAIINNPFNSTSTVSLVVVTVTSPATTSVRLSVATSTQGAGYFVDTGTATTTGLINRASLAANSTTTISSDTANYLNQNDTGFGSVKFSIGPRANITTATTTGSNKVTIGVVAQGNDVASGWTSAVNLASCTYSVKFESNETVR